ncbi:hypothetical protein C7R88_02265 [Plesiomonas shigelloides]|uniref:hypothetical protein n=1 Tax=Plesiomonas shigelloides TaxID=703 RepID=UPI000D126036|nr:hypothetical protein [Plesiomonas shigelloides]AVQ86235.1 hypothetical protein C7R88_02265 [Plesiomonas shigelloides]
MKFQGAVILEQGVTFAIVLVKKSVLSSNSKSDEVRASFQPYFPSLPIVLAAQDASGRFEYQGRKDLVNFLAKLHPSQIPWSEYTIS